MKKINNQIEFPFYYYIKGIFYYRIKRDYFNGECEVITRISRFHPDANEMAQVIVSALNTHRNNLQRDDHYEAFLHMLAWKNFWKDILSQ